MHVFDTHILRVKAVDVNTNINVRPPCDFLPAHLTTGIPTTICV